jgi:acyl-CoA thioesterase-1
VIRRRVLGLAAALVAACRQAGETGPPGPLVAFLGDSLTSGWKLRAADAYPALVGRTLRARGRPVRVQNAGVSGDTVAQGLARLERVLRTKPDVLVVALGINDGLRGLALENAERDLTTIVERGRASGARIVLVGMRIPDESGGAEYAARFREIYLRLAAAHRLHFVPFLLDGVAGVRDLTFPDGLHPNAAGHPRLAQNVVHEVELALAEVKG